MGRLGDGVTMRVGDLVIGRLGDNERILVIS